MRTTTVVPTVRLNNGVEMPVLGFGVFQIPPDQTEQTVADATTGLHKGSIVLLSTLATTSRTGVARAMVAFATSRASFPRVPGSRRPAGVPVAKDVGDAGGLLEAAKCPV
jgi:hypothetical protein